MIKKMLILFLVFGPMSLASASPEELVVKVRVTVTMGTSICDDFSERYRLHEEWLVLQGPIKSFRRLMRKAKNLTRDMMDADDSIRVGEIAEELCDKFDDAENDLEDIERITARTQRDRRKVYIMKRQLSIVRNQLLCM